ncbi:hypothetical protein AB0H82_29080 [Streptomyces sp. NPDC050732]|uniref:hypothetical protein n=1 Tax=Streptomyces sp. NPDC050732 TaxID=3154632 RepID=UPI0034157B0C
MDWYKVSESKAQLILTLNGLLVTLLLGAVAGNAAKEREFAKISGVETWVFFLASAGALAGAVACAAACLWSLHVRNTRGTFALLGVNPEDVDSYRPEALWYFGDLAHLQMEPAASLISRADRAFETQALSYNLLHLSRVVLRKHRFVNAGWTLTALAIILLILGGVSVVIRTQI